MYVCNYFSTNVDVYIVGMQSMDLNFLKRVYDSYTFEKLVYTDGCTKGTDFALLIHGIININTCIMYMYMYIYGISQKKFPGTVRTTEQ